MNCWIKSFLIALVLYFSVYVVYITIKLKLVLFLVEIGNNMEEVKRLRELHINQLQTNAQPAMPNSDDGHAVEAQLDLNLGL